MVREGTGSGNQLMWQQVQAGGSELRLFEQIHLQKQMHFAPETQPNQSSTLLPRVLDEGDRAHREAGVLAREAKQKYRTEQKILNVSLVGAHVSRNRNSAP